MIEESILGSAPEGNARRGGTVFRGVTAWGSVSNSLHESIFVIWHGVSFPWIVLPTDTVLNLTTQCPFTPRGLQTPAAAIWYESWTHMKVKRIMAPISCV